MAFQKTVTFDNTLQADDFRCYRVDDGEGGTEVHVTGLYKDSEGQVHSGSAKLSDLSTADQRAAIKAVSDNLAAIVAARDFDEV
jgi:hypothetical protein